MEYITIAGDTVRVVDHEGRQFIPMLDICNAFHTARTQARQRMIKPLGNAIVVENLNIECYNGDYHFNLCIRRDSLRTLVMAMAGNGKTAGPAVLRWAEALIQEKQVKPSDEVLAVEARISVLKSQLLDAYGELRRLTQAGDHVD